MKQTMCFKQVLSSFIILSILFSICIIPSQTFAANDNAGKVFKWLTLGAIGVGTIMAVATVGPLGLLLGPVVGFLAVSITSTMFGAGPLEPYKALKSLFSKKQTSASEVSSSYKTTPQTASKVTFQEAEKRYQKAYRNYTEAVSKGVSGEKLQVILNEYKSSSIQFKTLENN